MFVEALLSIFLLRRIDKKRLFVVSFQEWRLSGGPPMDFQPR